MKTCNTGREPGKGLLPQDKTEAEECEITKFVKSSQNRNCYKAGDSRANEQPGLTA